MNEYQVSVNLVEKTCKRWELTGIPCPHAVAVIWKANELPEDYVHEYYRLETYLRAYNYIIYPMNGPKMWPRSGLRTILPPKYGRMPGGPKMVRVREPDEQPKNTTKLNKYQTSGNCRRCGTTGHNARTCKFQGPVQERIRKRNRVYLFSLSNSFLFYF